MINIKKFVVTVLGGLLLTNSFVHAQPIQTPEEEQRAVVESTEGNMSKILSFGAKVVAPTVAKESGKGLKELIENSIFPIGEENVKYGQYFDGKSYLSMLSLKQVIIGNVTFEPGCRNHWHIHHATKGGGQLLLVTAGRGYYQEWGNPAQELHPGDVVNIPAGVKHWHGAAPDSVFQHLAIEVPGENLSNEWCEPVAQEEYDKLK